MKPFFRNLRYKADNKILCTHKSHEGTRAKRQEKKPIAKSMLHNFLIRKFISELQIAAIAQQLLSALPYKDFQCLRDSISVCFKYYLEKVNNTLKRIKLCI